MSPEDFDAISEEAERRYRQYRNSRGLRGQTVRPQDGLEFWYALAAFERGASSDEVLSQHIGWLKQYISGMDESNWRDMRLLAERQLEELSK